MILLYFQENGIGQSKEIPFKFQAKCDLIIGKREQELRFDVEKSRYGGSKYNLTLPQMIRHLVYYGVRRLSSRYN